VNEADRERIDDLTGFMERMTRQISN
jgi:hypothetical protein